MADDDWAAATSLEVFYHFNWPQPRPELILDFVEGFEYVQQQRGTCRVPGEHNIRSMVRGKPVEITAYVVRTALGFEEGADLVGHKVGFGFHERYSQYGLTEADHAHDGNRVTALPEAYQVRVRALSDAIGFKQRLLFASNDLLEHILIAEKAGRRHQTFD